LNTRPPGGTEDMKGTNGEPRRKRTLGRESIDPESSILAQRKDPDLDPEVTFPGEQYGRIKIHRDWSFGRSSPLRNTQPPHERSDYLKGDGSNLGLILNRFRARTKVKKNILEHLESLYSGITDFDVAIQDGSVQLYLQEGDFTIPASRLSDGTLRFLCLLALLCDPQPPPLICIEEPELGLHPDVIPGIAHLLLEASTRTQLVVTTHSNILVDALSESPEDVVICEKEDGRSILRRLDGESLRVWLKRYSLGELWRSGEIGGNRW
jgi:predicted ATPase